LDTSVVVSSVRSETGAARAITDSALRGEFELLLSVSLALEYEDVLLRDSNIAAAKYPRWKIEELLESLLGVSTAVELEAYKGPLSTDAGDNHILNLAMQAKADAIVTYNLRHFAAPCRDLGVNLYTPIDALRVLRSPHVPNDAD
jgi:putative PIN family toxin of toxin-antitoxin system